MCEKQQIHITLFLLAHLVRTMTIYCHAAVKNTSGNLWKSAKITCLTLLKGE